MLKSILAAVTRSLLGHSALEYFKSELIISVPASPAVGHVAVDFIICFYNSLLTSLALLNIPRDLEIRTKSRKSKQRMYDIYLPRI